MSLSLLGLTKMELLTHPTGRRVVSLKYQERVSTRGFTLLEILVSSALLIVVASSSFVLLVSARQLTQKPSHRSEALYFASETLEVLRDYVTARTAPTDTKYQFNVGGVASGTYALATGAAALVPAGPYTHELPAGFFSDPVASGGLGGTRTYTVTKEDVAPGIDKDLDGDPTNDFDYTKVTVTVTWEEQR